MDGGGDEWQLLSRSSLRNPGSGAWDVRLFSMAIPALRLDPRNRDKAVVILISVLALAVEDPDAGQASIRRRLQTLHYTRNKVDRAAKRSLL